MTTESSASNINRIFCIRDDLFVCATCFLFCVGLAQAQNVNPDFKVGDLVSSRFISGGCPTFDGEVAVLTSMAQTGKAHDVMVANDCLPFPATMKLRVKSMLKYDIMEVDTPDFPGSKPMFVAEAAFHKIQSTTSNQLEALPPLKKRTSYINDRKTLMALGYKPFKSPDADTCDASDDKRCYPEMESCAGTGLGNCLYTWKKDDSVIEVSTIGDPPEVNGVGRAKNAKP